MDNSDQFLQRNSKAASGSEKYSPFGRRDFDDAGNHGAQDSVFRPEMGDLVQQRRLGEVDQEQEHVPRLSRTSSRVRG